MLVGVMTVTLHMQGIGSLKDKRHIVKSVIGRSRAGSTSRSRRSSTRTARSRRCWAWRWFRTSGCSSSSSSTRILNFMGNDGRFFLGQVEREIFS